MHPLRRALRSGATSEWGGGHRECLGKHGGWPPSDTALVPTLLSGPSPFYSLSPGPNPLFPLPSFRSEALEARLQHWTNSDRDVAEAAEAESARVAAALAATCAELAALTEEHRLLRDSGEAMMEAKDAEVKGREGGRGEG